jgi:Cu-Zn family superoxide dismutase
MVTRHALCCVTTGAPVVRAIRSAATGSTTLRWLGLALSIVLWLTVGPGTALATGEWASGQLITGSGAVVGTVTMEQQAGGVAVMVSASGLTPGQHGIHVHAVGRCDPPDFTSAGGHANPTNRQHGLGNPAGPHAGDLPNLTADGDGKTYLSVTTNQFTLTPGRTSLFDADGAALIIHAQADDQVTDPAGNAGSRVACAVLRLSPPGLPRTGAGGPPPPDWRAAVGAALLAAVGATALARRRGA